MSYYIDLNYANTFLSEPQVNALLGYGENVSQSAKIQLLISASSDTVDSFLRVAGYTTPLTYVPASIQKATFYLLLGDLYSSANQEIPTVFADQISQQYAFLSLLRDKKLQLEGLEQDTTTGTGGNVIYGGTGTTSGESDRILSVQKLRGQFF